MGATGWAHEDVRVWPKEHVQQWLEQLGLAKYAAAFWENDINGEALVLLDDASLREVGISSIGHRMLLLAEVFRLKQEYGIPLEPGDYVPQAYAGADASDARVRALEDRVAQLQGGLQRIYEELGALLLGDAGAARPATASGAAPLPGAPFSAPLPAGSQAAIVPADHASAPLAAHGSAPISGGMPDTPFGAADTGPFAWTGEQGAVPERAEQPCDLSPVALSVESLLRAEGVQEPRAVHQPTTHVQLDDPCSRVLPAALHKYGIREDWRQYALFMCVGGTERCLAYDEKPLLHYHRLREVGQDPTFVLRSMRDVQSPMAMAEAKLLARRRDPAHARVQKHEAMRVRAELVELDQGPSGTARMLSVSHWLRDPTMSGARGEEALRRAHARGPAAELVHPGSSAMPHTYAVAVYPYESDREDEFDVRAGDTFIVLSKARGWWALRRDSVADGHGDVYVPNMHTPAGVPYSEIWTGWVPAGCLLELYRPLAEVLPGRAGADSPAASIARYTLPQGPSNPTQTLRSQLVSVPIPPSIVASSGSSGSMMVDFASSDGALTLRADERVRVLKRYHHWSYVIAEESGNARGWVPSWYIARRSAPPTPRSGGPR